MRKLLVAVMLLSLQASADTKILIEKADQQYIVIPSCNVSEDVTQVAVHKLRVGAPVYIRHKGRQVRCTIEDYYQVRS
jgi:hypothetical protein